MMLNLTRFEEFVRSIAIDDGYAGWEYEDGESMVNDAVAWLAAHDALAAEVERLTAELEAEVRQLKKENQQIKDELLAETTWGEAMEMEVTALRSQLDAGEGWRPVSEAPEKKGYYLGWRGDRVVWAGYWPGEYYPDSSPWVDEVGLDIAITHWRPLPAPPQE